MTDANLPTSARWISKTEDAAKRQRKRLFMISRRNFLITTSAALITAPAIVHIANIMPVRKVILSFQGNYHYGFVSRLWIDHRYRSGQLSDDFLVHAIEQGLLNHIPRERLARDLITRGIQTSIDGVLS
jgi:hypothetical protein